MKNAAIYMLRLYKGYVSPLFGTSCRFVPTCSEYAQEALKEYGLLQGGLMAVWRVLRCNPFSRGGYDPVKKQEQKG